ncbi:MAG TPA: hypothetical protein VEA99_12290 [Gemmatimonadaceae bacterium]|nr:hypothetical protein [Gemmatimonadaceae bacterium]
MFIRRTPAFVVVRAQLAQSSRELATVLVGLEAVRTGAASPPAGFRPPWDDEAARESAVRHARRFAFDAALARIVDALDGYLARQRATEPLAAAVPALATQERSVKARLDAIWEGLDLDCTLEQALAHLAIQWRNRRWHSGSANRLEQRYVAKIRASAFELRARHGGLTPERLLDHFEASRSPRPRELSALARATGEACGQADRGLLLAVSPAAWAEHVLRERFADAERREGEARLEEVWKQPPEKRRGRLEHLLRASGFRNRALAESQRALDDTWLESLARCGAREAAARFGLLDERSEQREEDARSDGA